MSKQQANRLQRATTLVTINLIFIGYSAGYLFSTGSVKEGILFSLAGLISFLAILDLKKLASPKQNDSKSSLLDDPYFIDRARIYS